MALLLKTKKKTVKITINKEGQSGVFEVEPLTLEEDNDLRKEFTTSDLKFGQVVDNADYLEMRIAKAQKTIKSWEINDEDTGKPLPCTADNIRAIYLLNPTIIDDVLSKADSENQKLKKKKEAAAKN